MAFKMADGSLFSILLRSPWWYSFFIAGFFLAVGSAVARGQYLIFGITAALPFLAISGFAGFRQLRRPSKKRVLEVVQIARKMRSRELAEKIAAAYVSERFRMAPFKGDAADLEITRGSRTILLCAKRFKAATTGIEQLKQFVDAGRSADATGYLYVTLGDISEHARAYASKNNIEFIQPAALAEFFDGKAKIT